MSRPTRSAQATPRAHFNSDKPRKRQKFVSSGISSGRRWEEFDESLRAASALRTPASSNRRRGRPPKPQPTLGSTAAEAAAAVQVDGYKPREERSWEEFHPDLDPEISLAVFTADEIDGYKGASPASGMSPSGAGAAAGLAIVPIKRGPGRPPRQPESMLTGLGSPPAPRITPLPSQNPKERLNLPKPSFRRVQTFSAFENDRAQQVNYVDKGMAHVGYQESEMFQRPETTFIRLEGHNADDGSDNNLLLEADRQVDNEHHPVGVTRVEYDMDEQDERWLEAHNSHRKIEDVDVIRPSVFEITMTQIEKEWHALEKRIPKPNPKPPQTTRPRSNSAAAVNGEAPAAGEEQDSKCSICDDGDCENTNAIIFCDGCDIAVHQECYGVPFIPEGQWLCRKCQNIGRGVPTCIFCPNTEGAFKLTTEQRWAHLLCAIWIPEVSLSNPSLMEPIDGVAKVPKQRWKLNCYICQQKMGACIQCSNRNCFQAFHVSCARRAKLYLKMKSTQGGPATLDASVLKALCDKHVPEDWGHEHKTERATLEAKHFYRRAMKGRRWADSQMSALAMVHQTNVEAPPGDADPYGEDPSNQANTAAQRKKAVEAQKNVWRLPSGAPIVPHVVFEAVENSLARFAIRRRKEFVAEACKYWTLKREARRGAALLKRLQLQMETFSSSEITRRDFVAMGSAGRTRLERRIKFADQMLADLERIRQMVDTVREREAVKYQSAELLRDNVEAIYFPINTLLVPIMDKALLLNSNSQVSEVFDEGLDKIKAKTQAREYTSVSAFSSELASVFKSIPGLEFARDTYDLQQYLQHKSLRDITNLPSDQKEYLKLAKRIISTVGPMLQDATRKETELITLKPAKVEEVFPTQSPSKSGGKKDLRRTGEGERSDEASTSHEQNNLATPEGEHEDETKDGESASLQDRIKGEEGTGRQPPLTPPRSEKDTATAFARGGVPDCLELFDISGTTVHEERWTGRDVLRGMSEELSEMGEEELIGLGGSYMGEAAAQDDDDDEPRVSKATPGGERSRSRRQVAAQAPAAARAKAVQRRSGRLGR